MSLSSEQERRLINDLKYWVRVLDVVSDRLAVQHPVKIAEMIDSGRLNDLDREAFLNVTDIAFLASGRTNSIFWRVRMQLFSMPIGLD